MPTGSGSAISAAGICRIGVSSFQLEAMKFERGDAGDAGDEQHQRRRRGEADALGRAAAAG